MNFRNNFSVDKQGPDFVQLLIGFERTMTLYGGWLEMTLGHYVVTDHVTCPLLSNKTTATAQWRPLGPIITDDMALLMTVGSGAAVQLTDGRRTLGVQQTALHGPAW